MGRTGTFIALDITLDQMNAEKTVDIKGTVQKMRQKRMHMVQTVVGVQSHTCSTIHVQWLLVLLVHLFNLSSELYSYEDIDLGLLSLFTNLLVKNSQIH